MTECSPVISISQRWNIRSDSVGQLVPNCEAKTVDGELWVKGSSVMQGYYKMPEETAETLEDGWLKTGDLGYVDEEGFVYLTGRKKNLIITKNGENVSPEELENALSTNRLVGEVLVREKGGVIEAEIYPDQDFVKKKRIKDVREKLQEVIDEYNAARLPRRRIYSLVVRETEFEENDDAENQKVLVTVQLYSSLTFSVKCVRNQSRYCITRILMKGTGVTCFVPESGKNLRIRRVV